MLEPDHDEAELQNDADDFLSAMVEELESLIDEQYEESLGQFAMDEALRVDRRALATGRGLPPRPIPQPVRLSDGERDELAKIRAKQQTSKAASGRKSSGEAQTSRRDKGQLGRGVSGHPDSEAASAGKVPRKKSESSAEKVFDSAKKVKGKFAGLGSENKQTVPSPPEGNDTTIAGTKPPSPAKDKTAESLSKGAKGEKPLNRVAKKVAKKGLEMASNSVISPAGGTAILKKSIRPVKYVATAGGSLLLVIVLFVSVIGAAITAGGGGAAAGGQQPQLRCLARRRFPTRSRSMTVTRPGGPLRKPIRFCRRVLSRVLRLSRRLRTGMRSQIVSQGGRLVVQHRQRIHGRAPI